MLVVQSCLCLCNTFTKSLGKSFSETLPSQFESVLCCLMKTRPYHFWMNQVIGTLNIPVRNKTNKKNIKYTRYNSKVCCIANLQKKIFPEVWKKNTYFNKIVLKLQYLQIKYWLIFIDLMAKQQGDLLSPSFSTTYASISWSCSYFHLSEHFQWRIKSFLRSPSFSKPYSWLFISKCLLTECLMVQMTLKLSSRVNKAYFLLPRQLQWETLPI